MKLTVGIMLVHVWQHDISSRCPIKSADFRLLFSNRYRSVLSGCTSVTSVLLRVTERESHYTATDAVMHLVSRFVHIFLLFLFLSRSSKAYYRFRYGVSRAAVTVNTSVLIEPIGQNISAQRHEVLRDAALSGRRVPSRTPIYALELCSVVMPESMG